MVKTATMCLQPQLVVMEVVHWVPESRVVTLVLNAFES